MDEDVDVPVVEDEATVERMVDMDLINETTMALIFWILHIIFHPLNGGNFLMSYARKRLS